MSSECRAKSMAIKEGESTMNPNDTGRPHRSRLRAHLKVLTTTLWTPSNGPVSQKPTQIRQSANCRTGLRTG
jgi:hypothetical protein